MLPHLPIDLWGSILMYIDKSERVSFCKYLINLGIVKIHYNLFNTYMLLLDESMKYDTNH